MCLRSLRAEKKVAIALLISLLAEKQLTKCDYYEFIPQWMNLWMKTFSMCVCVTPNDRSASVWELLGWFVHDGMNNETKSHSMLYTRVDCFMNEIFLLFIHRNRMNEMRVICLTTFGFFFNTKHLNVLILM